MKELEEQGEFEGKEQYMKQYSIENKTQSCRRA
jgi:hypothetical protein